MKKKVITLVLTLIAVITATLCIAGCNAITENEIPTDDSMPKTFTIQYTDDAGTHQIEVAAGMPYSLDVVPSKTGYEFTGLYDAEVGGTQYISATGASLSPFTDGKNMVLFPRFKAKDYTVILDYQGAAVTGTRQFTVTYGSSLPELPKNLTGEHKEFTGWYTKANCEGTHVADKYGLIPVASVFNATNFDLNGEYIYLYAGFETEKHTVTFCFESGMDTEEVKVAYNTSISEVVPETRVNGKAVLTWSKTQGGEVWNGKVTDDMVLYAKEYAPVIELDANGGNKINPVVARAGSTIALPTPTKELAKFAYWEDMQGNKFTSTTMPSSSISLKAVWQAKIVFDENGGSDVNDISVAAGTQITLPMPEKEGFVFAGWYTADKTKYTSTTMPSAGVKLKAGWYVEKNETVVLSNKYDTKYNAPSVKSLVYAIPCSKYLNGQDSINIKIDWHVKVFAHSSYTGTFTAYVDFYSQRQVSSSWFLGKEQIENITTLEKEATFTTSFTVSDDIYAMWYTNRDHSSWWYNDQYWYIQDHYYTIYYPDTTNLYL